MIALSAPVAAPLHPVILVPESPLVKHYRESSGGTDAARPSSSPFPLRHRASRCHEPLATADSTAAGEQGQEDEPLSQRDRGRFVCGSRLCSNIVGVSGTQTAITAAPQHWLRILDA